MLHAMEYLIHCIMFIAAPVKTEGKKKIKSWSFTWCNQTYTIGNILKAKYQQILIDFVKILGP